MSGYKTRLHPSHSWVMLEILCILFILIILTPFQTTSDFLVQGKILVRNRSESIYRYIDTYRYTSVRRCTLHYFDDNQYNIGFENSTFDRRARSSKFKNGLWQKATKFWKYTARKEYDAAECYLCSNELQHPVGKQISLSITNDIINLSPSQPNAPRIWRNLLITSDPWLF